MDEFVHSREHTAAMQRHLVGMMCGCDGESRAGKSRCGEANHAGFHQMRMDQINPFTAQPPSQSPCGTWVRASTCRTERYRRDTPRQHVARKTTDRLKSTHGNLESSSVGVVDE